MHLNKVYLGRQRRSCSIAVAALLLISASHVANAQLMCYICEDCAKIEVDTPLLECNEGFFNTPGTELPSTQTTTTEAMTTTQDPATEESETPMVSSTSTSASTATSSGTNETTDEPVTTTIVPTPPTAGPVETTEAIPTPPNPGTVVTISVEQMLTNLENSTILPVRQVRLRRDTKASDYTYHCYSLQKEVNGTWQTDRGCSRVTTMQDVCDELTTMYNVTKLNKCRACSNNQCNSATTIMLSLLPMSFGVVAAFVLNRL